jgi:HK97 family phage major capsid protein
MGVLVRVSSAFEEVVVQSLEDVLLDLSGKLDRLDGVGVRGPSRFVGAGAAPEYVERVARSDWRVVRNDAVPERRGGVASLMAKALAEGTGPSGGFLVPVEFASEILLALRARSAVMRMGPTVVQVKKELDLTSLSSGASASYVAENAAIPISEQTFAQGPLLRPKQLAALVPVSNRLLRDADDNPAVEAVVRSDLAEVLALRADLAFLTGTGTGGEPLGIVNFPGITAGPSLGANGGTPTYDDLKDTVAALRELNAPFNRPGFVFHPRLLSTLEKLKDANGRYLADADLLTFDATGGGGTLLGYPFRTTTQLPTNLTVGSSDDTTVIVFSSDWNEGWVGENEALTLEVSTEASYTVDGTTWVSSYQNDQSLFRAKLAHDIAPRRPQLVTTVTGVRP